MNWNWLREKLNEMAESESDEVKAFLETQVIAMIDASGTIPLHLSQSLVDGELCLYPMEVAPEKK